MRFSSYVYLSCKSHANVCWPVILNVIRGHGWIRNAVVDDRVDADGDRVPRQHLLGWHVEGDRSQVDLLVTVRTRNDEKYTRPLGSSCKKKSSQTKRKNETLEDTYVFIWSILYVQKM